MIIYRFRNTDMVYDCEVEVPDGTTAIPPFHTFQAPPVQENHYAVMRNGWILVFGEKPSPPLPPPPRKYVPEKVTRFQAKAVLYNMGLLTTAQSLVDSSENPLVKLVWQEALHFERNSPTLNLLAQDLGLSEEQIDDLFIEAEQITV
jgi:hypothetical protein